MSETWIVALSTIPVSVLFTVLVFLTKNWVSERLRQSISLEYARSLEKFKSEIAQYQSVQTAVMGSLTTVHLAGHSRRLAAIETFWRETVRLRERTPTYASRADILRPDEFESSFRNDPVYAATINEVSEYEEAMDLIGNRPDVEVARAFCGEYLFALFWAYRAFIGRVALLLRHGFEKGKVTCWHDISTYAT